MRSRPKPLASSLLAFLLTPLALPAAFAQQPPPPAAPSIADPGVHDKIVLKTPADPNLPTLFLVGDSTVRNGREGNGAGGMWGWGDTLAPFFDTSRINVVNRAIGGLSSRTYINGNHWAETLALIKPGDLVLFQFGHNDGGALDDPARARATILGIGDESKEIENPILKHHETVHTFGWYMRQYIADTRAKGATPILCSLVPRKGFRDGKAIRNADTYAGWTRQVAAQEHAGFIDLNEIIARRYDALGPEKVELLFGDPHTHTSLAGAELNAECVVSGLKALPGDPAEPFFSAKGKAVRPYVEVSSPGAPS